MRGWLGFVFMGCLAACRLQGESMPAGEASAGLAHAPASDPGVFYDSGMDGDFRAIGPRPLVVEEPVPRVDRQVIYSAGLRLVVVSVADTLRTIQGFAVEAGGYLQESDAGSITVRVPAPKFEEVLNRIGRLGEVLDRSVKASDVTEEMLDLDIRLDNARKTRERLLEHLSKSTKIEDTLKIEAELARVSGEIEQIEGKLRFFRSQVAMSTVRVELNTRLPQGPSSSAGLGLPFAWLDQLGDGLVAGNVEGRPRKPGFFSGGPRFDPPPEFVRYYQGDDLVEAMNADGLRIKVQRHANFDQGGLAFWRKLARKALVETRSLAVVDERDLEDGSALIAGQREVAGVPCGYALVLSRTRDRVWSFEAWGPKAELEAHLERILSSAKTLKR